MSKLGRKVAVIVGAGDGVGAAIGRAFAKQGLSVLLARRPRNMAKTEALAASITEAGGDARAMGADVRLDADVKDLFAAADELGDLEVVVHNIGGNVRRSIADTSPQVFRKVWELATHSAFLTAHAAAERMVPAGRGVMLFSGATAAVRGSSGFAAFSSAMHGKRALAQSLASELGPKGVHVAHICIDGAIDSPFVREIACAAPGGEARYEHALANGGLLETDAIAEQYVNVWKQPRCAWTHELDLRPWSEPPWWSGGKARL